MTNKEKIQQLRDEIARLEVELEKLLSLVRINGKPMRVVSHWTIQSPTKRNRHNIPVIEVVSR